MALKNKNTSKGTFFGRINFFIYPVVFFLVSACILIVALYPIINPMISVLNVAFLAEPPDFQAQAQNLYAADSFKESGNKKIHIEPSQVPTEGERFGELIIESAGISAPIYYGDGSKELLSGIGCYTGSYIPGLNRTTLLAGHNYTYLRPISEAKVGDKIKINTNYGKYVYEITEAGVKNKDDKTAIDLKKQEENLVIYTCYPFNALGITPYRYFVYAKYISGPKLDLVY